MVLRNHRLVATGVLVLAGVLTGGSFFAVSRAAAATIPPFPSLLFVGQHSRSVVVRDDVDAMMGSQQLLVLTRRPRHPADRDHQRLFCTPPAGAVDTLRHATGWPSVTLDQKLQLTNSTWDTTAA